MFQVSKMQTDAEEEEKAQKSAGLTDWKHSSALIFQSVDVKTVWLARSKLLVAYQC